MKLIKPSEISARILTLLEESNERVILVSPYMKISKWYKFMNKINGLKSKRIHVAIYVRDDPENAATYRDLDQSELPYYKIPHLHSKLYLNERYGIVTSMNLLLSSEINSLEIGYETETWEEYNDLLAFYQGYIHIGHPHHFDNIAGQPAADLNELMSKIRNGLKSKSKNAWLWHVNNELYINTGRNNYIVSIQEGYVRIDTYLKIVNSLKIAESIESAKSAKTIETAEFPQVTSETTLNKSQGYSLIAKKIRDLTAMKVYINPGPENEILLLSARTYNPMKSRGISAILETELASIMESLIRFIDTTENLRL